MRPLIVALLGFAVNLVFTFSVPADSKQPKFCTVASEFEDRIHDYQGCIAYHAREYEITGDLSESVPRRLWKRAAHLK